MLTNVVIVGATTEIWHLVGYYDQCFLFGGYLWVHQEEVEQNGQFTAILIYSCRRVNNLTSHVNLMLLVISCTKDSVCVIRTVCSLMLCNTYSVVNSVFKRCPHRFGARYMKHSDVRLYESFHM